MRRGAARRLWLAIVTVMLVGGCTAARPGGYPLPAEQPNAHQFSPAALGVPSTAVVIYLRLRPGDRIELVGAEAVGTLDGAAVTMLVSRPVIEANGDQVIGAAFEPLDGAMLTAVSASPGPDNDIGIAGRLVADQSGALHDRHHPPPLSPQRRI